jgi:hypothetical protein
MEEITPPMLRSLTLAAVMALAAAHMAAAADFDARSAKDVLAVVTSNGASGEFETGKDGKPAIKGQAGRIFFDVYFDDCDTRKALCDTIIFTGSWDSKTVKADEINRWNRWTLFCPAYLEADGSPDMWYSVAVSVRTGKDDVADSVERWMNCLQDFDGFVGAPEDFLKRNAPEEATPAAGAAGRAG